MDVPLHSIPFHGLVLVCPFSQKFRRHTEVERAVMRASIEANGIHESVKLYSDTTLKTDNCVLDGEGRLTIAVDLKLPFDGVRFEHGLHFVHQL